MGGREATLINRCACGMGIALRHPSYENFPDSPRPRTPESRSAWERTLSAIISPPHCSFRPVQITSIPG
ncbi:hypothetical protein SAMN05216209_1859 [Pseudomonas nitroreducens]|nr:hypothetical protein SAMN05216209_1859 [Pseudomonas nitroreducens]